MKEDPLVTRDHLETVALLENLDNLVQMQEMEMMVELKEMQLLGNPSWKFENLNHLREQIKLYGEHS